MNQFNKLLSNLKENSFVVPKSWFDYIKNKKGLPYFNAIYTLAWLVNNYEFRDKKTNEIDTSYNNIATDLHLSKRQIKAALNYLVQMQLITKEFRTIYIEEAGRDYPNVMFLTLIERNFSKITVV